MKDRERKYNVVRKCKMIYDDHFALLLAMSCVTDRLHIGVSFLSSVNFFLNSFFTCYVSKVSLELERKHAVVLSCFALTVSYTEGKNTDMNESPTGALIKKGRC